MGISVENKITIRRWIDSHPAEAKQIEKGSDSALEKMSNDTGLNLVYLRYNLQQIKNWV